MLMDITRNRIVEMIVGPGDFGKVKIFDCSEFQDIVTNDYFEFFCPSFSS